jgi:hypothetical protein
VVREHGSITKLYDHPGQTVSYTSYEGPTVIGMLKVVPALKRGVVAEMNKTRAFPQIETLQRMTPVLVGGLLIGIGLCA